MSALSRTLRIARNAAVVGFRDRRTIFTWQTWLAGWFVRVVAQVSFFALIGLLVESPELLRFLLIANVPGLAARTALGRPRGATWVRYAGTLPLLVASPSSHVAVFTARGFDVLLDGTVTAASAFLVAAPLFGVDLPWPRALFVFPLFGLVATSTYCFGVFVGSFVLRKPGLRNLVTNVLVGIFMVLCGVNVPLAALPDVFAAVGRILPLTHGLLAIRSVLDGGPGTAAFVAVEAAVGLWWLVAGALSLTWFVEAGRRSGTIEFGA
jgi:ABC-2 type transport system permease protein